MPSLRGLEVHVTNEYGTPLEEYGTSTNGRAGTATCYIMSQTDMAFRISIAPTIPFPRDGLEAEVRKEEKKKRDQMTCSEQLQQYFGGAPPAPPMVPKTAVKPKERGFRRTLYRDGQPVETTYSHGNFDDEDRNVHHMRTRKAWMDQRDSSNLADDEGMSEWKDGTEDDGVQYHLLASLYLDGRKTPERRCIVYLDRKHPDFPKNGRITMAHRWVQSPDGSIMQHAWVFKEVGIETLLDKLLLGNNGESGDNIVKRDEEELLNALAATGLEDKEESKAAGQIQITLQKVTVGLPYDEWNYHTTHRAGQREDIDMADMDGLTHTTGIRQDRRQFGAGDPVRVVNYTEIDRGKALATFKFFYRSLDVLQKFNFKNLPSTPNAPRNKKTPSKRRINDQFTNLTPLSFRPTRFDQKTAPQ